MQNLFGDGSKCGPLRLVSSIVECKLNVGTQVRRNSVLARAPHAAVAEENIVNASNHGKGIELGEHQRMGVSEIQEGYSDIKTAGSRRELNVSF